MKSVLSRWIARPAGLLAAGALALAATSPALAQDLANLQVFRTGFVEPAFMASPPGEPERIMVGSLRGVIWVIENGVLLPTPFLDIQDRVRTAHGLIGVAFPPDYATSRRFYVNYTAEGIDGPRIARYTTSANPNVANREEEILLDHGPGAGDHNAGWIGFSNADGYLYVARGDVFGIPQSPDFYQGKILRLDVSPQKGYAIPADNMFVGTSGIAEIAAIGMRNPWRCGTDSLTGDLYITDVGDLSQEEINYVPAGTMGGRNFGWPCYEGTICRTGAPAPCACDMPGLTMPIHTYSHTEGYAIIGGPVYRGSAIPRWRGRYFFMDWFNGKIWSFRVVNGVKTDLQEHSAGLNETLPANQPARLGITFGTDGAGELYILELGGRILKMAPEFHPADWDLDGTVNSADFFAFLVDFFNNNADLNGDHTTGSPDFFEYLTYFFGQ